MQVVHNALRVLEEIGRRQPIGVSELHRSLGLPKTTVQRSLGALAAAGWIRVAGDRTHWILTTRAASVGRDAGNAEGLRDVARPAMEELRGTTSETIHLTVPEDGQIVLIERLDSAHALRPFYALGSRAPMHASANGKAILAHLPRAEVDALLTRGMRRFTATTITDPARFHAELDRVRAVGWASNAGELQSEVAAVASAVLDERGRPVASISISCPASRLPAARRPQFGRLVADATTDVSAALAQPLRR